MNLMSMVYKNAKEVVAWLGNESKLDGMMLLDFRWLCEHEELLYEKLGDASTIKDQTLPLWYFLDYLNNDYWSRIWIVQEVILARNLVFRYKTVKISEKHLQFALACLKKCHGESESQQFDPLRYYADMIAINHSN